MGYQARAKGLFVAGNWIETSETEAVINPATENVIGDAPVGTREIVDDALSAARKSFDEGPWRKAAAEERQATLTRFLDAIDRRRSEFVDLIVAEAGSTRPLAEALQYQIPMNHARHAVRTCTRPAMTPLPVELNPTAQGTKMLGAGVMVREPVGVVTAITPYNFPFFLNIGKVVPALAVGCSVVLKPSPYTPFEALILGEIAQEAGLPEGVLNIVTGGIEAGEMLTSDPRVDLVTFTGSDTVGAKIQAQAAPTLKRLVMELGGKSALIVREDADIHLAAIAGLMGFTVHCGQGCALLTRHIVHNSVKDQFVGTVKAMAESLKIGDPADSSSMLGPLIREAQRKRTEDYVDVALQGGAKLVTGGKRPPGLDKGFFYEPTLFTDVSNTSRIAQEEVFGPIAVVIGYDTDEEAIALANDSDFGLSGGIYSADPARAFEMALEIRTGGVSINGGTGAMSSNFPFGGIKRSGYGREYGEEGLNEFTYIKTIGFHGA